MTMYSASGQRTRPPEHRRQPKPNYDPLKERGKMMADLLWERAMQIAQLLAPEVPSDQEELPEQTQWMLLERVAMSLSPAAWDDPQAITDLYKLRQKFAPHLAHEWMPIMAKYHKKQQAGLPDPAITPENPEFQKNLRRLNR